MRIRAGLVAGLLMLCTAALAEDETFGTLSVTVENDIIGQTDRDYTSGVRLDYISERGDLPWLGRLTRRNIGGLIDAPDWYMTYALGQNIFTPTDISLANPAPGERPYAGFLYASFGIAADRGDRLDHLALEIGMVGPSSLAEQSQKLVHNMFGFTEPEGWNTQLADEPAFRLVYERKYRFSTDLSLAFLDLKADVGPHFNLSLGTIDTSAGIGGTVRLGRNLSSGYGPPRIRPAVSSPGFFRTTSGVTWYLFAGVEGRVVGRNLFIQGNTFGGVDGVEPIRLVADVQAGLALRFRGAEIAYTHVLRTREYEGQDGFSEFGSLNLRFKL